MRNLQLLGCFAKIFHAWLFNYGFVRDVVNAGNGKRPAMSNIPRFRENIPK